WLDPSGRCRRRRQKYVPQCGITQSVNNGGWPASHGGAGHNRRANYLLLIAVHSMDEPVITKPWPLQAFWPLQADDAVLQALCPLQALAPVQGTWAWAEAAKVLTA